MLGRNYAPTDPNPETAVLTKFRSSEQDYVKVKFYSAKEWDKLWKSVQSDAEKFLELYKELEAEKYKSKWVEHDEMCIDLANNEIEDELKNGHHRRVRFIFLSKRSRLEYHHFLKSFQSKLYLLIHQDYLTL